MKFVSTTAVDWRLLNNILKDKLSNVTATATARESKSVDSEGDIQMLVEFIYSNRYATHKDHLYCQKLISDLKLGQVEFPINLFSCETDVADRNSSSELSIESNNLVQFLRISAALSIFGWCCRTNQNSDCQLCCEICDRVIPFNNIVSAMNADSTADIRGHYTFSLISDHRFFCPWISSFLCIGAIGTSNPPTSPGWQLCDSAVHSDGKLLISHYNSVRCADASSDTPSAVRSDGTSVNAPLRDVFDRINAVVNMMSDLPS